MSWRKMPRITPAQRKHGGKTSSTVCKVKNTENFMILQVIQYRSIGECIRDIPPWRCSKRSRNDGRYNTSPSQFQWRNIFMSMFNDIEWWTSQNESKCVRDAVEVANYSRNVAHGCWSFLGSGKWKATWFGTSRDTTKEKWNDIGHKVKQFPIERTPDILIIHWKGVSSKADVEEKLFTLLYRFQAVLNCLWGRYWKWVK